MDDTHMLIRQHKGRNRHENFHLRHIRSILVLPFDDTPIDGTHVNNRGLASPASLLGPDHAQFRPRASYPGRDPGQPWSES